MKIRYAHRYLSQKVMAESVFKPPSTLDLNSVNLADSFKNFKKWRRQLEVYLKASGADEKPDDVRSAIILHCAGPAMIEVFDHFTFAKPEDKCKPRIILEKMEDYCSPRKNVVLNTFRFWMAPSIEPFESFLTDLRTKAESCEFGQLKERMIRDKTVFTVTGYSVN